MTYTSSAPRDIRGPFCTFIDSVEGQSRIYKLRVNKFQSSQTHVINIIFVSFDPEDRFYM